MKSEQQAILIAKPLHRMRRFAELLGWKGLNLEFVTFNQKQIQDWDVPKSGIITYYQTPDLKFNLQINERPSGDPFTHQMTVKATRYGVVNTGWSGFTLYEDESSFLDEADRLCPLFQRGRYKGHQSALAMASRFPDAMYLPTKKKSRGGRRRAG